MSESAKKKLVQKRLPFAIIPTEKTSTLSPMPAVNSSPKTPLSSRKRKPSTDGDTGRSNKIGRVADLKENISSKEVVVNEDDDDNAELAPANLPSKECETTPTTTAPESTLHIKLQSASKSKRKIIMSSKPQKSLEEDPDDSVVYLDEEEIPKKSRKKSEKKKKKAGTSDEKAAQVKKNLKLSESIGEENENVEHDPNEIGDTGSAQSDKKEEMSDVVSMDDQPTNKSNEVIDEQLDDLKKDEAPSSPDLDTSKALSTEERFKTIPSKDTSPQEPEAIHDEIIGILSDDSNDSADKTSPGNETGGKDSSAPKFDITKITPKQLARRKEQEARRLEKELARQKERDAKEQQRLKEKELREDAKRKEKEEKEEARKREKEERDRKKQVRFLHDFPHLLEF